MPPFDIGDAVDLIEAAAPDNADNGVVACHAASVEGGVGSGNRNCRRSRRSNAMSPRGAATGGNPAAWNDTMREATAFFGRYLKP
jgi:hypothetical protein